MKGQSESRNVKSYRVEKNNFFYTSIWNNTKKDFEHQNHSKTQPCSKIDGPRDYYTKWSKLDKDKYHMVSLKCGI